MKVHVHVKDELGNDLIEPNWYAGNRAAELFTHLIPDLHGPSAPIPGVEFQQPEPARYPAIPTTP